MYNLYGKKALKIFFEDGITYNEDDISDFNGRVQKS